MIHFIKNERLETIKSGHLGNQVIEGRFLNYQKIHAPKLKEILKWKFTNNSDRIIKKSTPWHAPLIELHPNQLLNIHDRIVWLGHATFLITLNGKNIIIDPVFSDILLTKRIVNAPCKIEDLTNIDYILISHSHFDHLDKKSLQKLTSQNPQAVIYCGINHQGLLKQFKIKNDIVEAGWYQKFPSNRDNIEIYFLPALHWSKRTIHDRNQRLWGSFAIKSQTSSIYFMGDSGYSSHFKEIGNLFSGFDYCLMGIGAYTPRNIMQFSHVNPYEAITGFHDLQGKNFVPMHYGTYDLTDEPLWEPLKILEEISTKHNLHHRIKALKIGEILQL